MRAFRCTFAPGSRDRVRRRHHRNLGTLPQQYNPQPFQVRRSPSAGGRRIWERGRRGRGHRLFRLGRWPANRFWRGPRRVQFGDHRIGIDGSRGGRREIAGNIDDLHRDGDRQELVQGVGDREAAIDRGHRDRAGRLAARPQRRLGVGARRNRSSWTWTVGGVGLKESVENEEHPARLTPATAIATIPRIPVTLLRLVATNPRRDLRSVRLSVQSYREGSLRDG